MKEFKLNKNSWHFKLATKFSIMTEHEADTTMCRYFWSVLLGGFAVLFLFALACSLAIVVGFLLHQWYEFFVQGFKLNAGVVITITTVIIIGGKFFIEWAQEKVEQKRRAKRKAYWDAVDAGTYKEPEPGFLKQAYMSWKEKTCHKIVFTYSRD